MRLNYHHLRYFHGVASIGHLGRAAEHLNVSQSALSMQIRQLEEAFGTALFDRVGRGLELTEAGRVAFDHASQIFGTGEELVQTLTGRRSGRAPLQVGALSTLSRNFQLRFLRPLLEASGTGFVLRSGNTTALLNELESLSLDVVLTTAVPNTSRHPRFAAQRIAQQSVLAHGRPESLRYATLRELLAQEPVILPTESTIETGFRGLVSRLDVEPRIIASVDDMAMVRLLAREGVGVAIAPTIVLADEIAAGKLQTAPFDLGIDETFYAVTLPRRFPHPALKSLLAAQAI